MAKTKPQAPPISAALQARQEAFLAAFAQSALPSAGVSAPAGGHFWALMLLWENLGQPVSQAQIVQFYVDHGLGHYDRQVRHKAAAGWRLVSGSIRAQNMEYDPAFAPNEIALVSMEPNPRLTANRKVQLSGLEWDEKVALFEHRRGGCGMCGQKCHAYDRGHLDRRQPMTVDNIAPLCPGCNNWLQAMDMDAYVEEDTLKVRPVTPGSTRFERMRRKRQHDAHTR